MVRLDIETMWNECDLAVLGKVNSINSSEEGGYYRIVEIEVETCYLRQLDESTVRVRIEGDDSHVWVEDQPEFTVGEHVFVFLSAPEEITGDYEYEVYGMYQGKWSVDGSTAVRGSQSFELPSDEDLEKIAAERADSLIDDNTGILGLPSIVAVGLVAVSLLTIYRLVKR
ncbi:hypothetical protein JXL21_02690 [Candidatus Bathyarchaeota archaeon]|nr:hypothetical protein [Candidatus Bathyarchaeota archaeon]